MGRDRYPVLRISGYHRVSSPSIVSAYFSRLREIAFAPDSRSARQPWPRRPRSWPDEPPRLPGAPPRQRAEPLRVPAGLTPGPREIAPGARGPVQPGRGTVPPLFWRLPRAGGELRHCHAAHRPPAELPLHFPAPPRHSHGSPRIGCCPLAYRLTVLFRPIDDSPIGSWMNSPPARQSGRSELLSSMRIARLGWLEYCSVRDRPSRAETL